MVRPPVLRAAKLSRSARGVAAGGVRSAALDPPGDSRGKRTGQSRETPDPFAFVCAVVWFAACIFAFRPGENIRSSRFFFCALVWMALCAAASMFRPRAPGRHGWEGRSSGGSGETIRNLQGSRRGSRGR